MTHILLRCSSRLKVTLNIYIYIYYFKLKGFTSQCTTITGMNLLTIKAYDISEQLILHATLTIKKSSFPTVSLIPNSLNADHNCLCIYDVVLAGVHSTYQPAHIVDEWYFLHQITHCTSVAPRRPLFNYAISVVDD